MRLLCDNSSPRPPEKFLANPNTIIESLPIFPTPVEDSDSLREEIDIFPGSDDSIPPGIKSDDDVVEDIPMDVPNILPTHPTFSYGLRLFPSRNDLGSNLDGSSPSRDRNKIYDLGICIEVESTRFFATLSPVIDTLFPFSSENKDKVYNHGVLASKEKSHPSSSHRGFKASNPFHHKSPMLIHGANNPNLGVRHPHFYPPWYVVPAGRVIVVPTGRYVVPAGRVVVIVVPTGRYVVPAGKVIIIVSPGKLSLGDSNGNSLKRTGRDLDGRVIILPPTTTDEHIAVWWKCRIQEDEKSMLKQEFSEFRISESEGLHKGYDRMQKILSQLNQLKAKPDDEDINLKFLRSLPSSWSQVALTLKNKGGLEHLTFDDLYYKLKTLEIDIKGYSTHSSSQSPNHSAFVSTTSTSKKMSYAESPSFSSSTYSTPSSSRTRSHNSGNVLQDVLHSFIAESEPE
ncbi:hypothetical protein Tco_1275900 [Tanacetum coccineum]